MKTHITKKLKEKINLTQEEARGMLEMLLSSEIDDENKGDMLRLLSQKGETEDEIFGFIIGMRKHMISLDALKDAIDTCGTGGDGKDSFNISTASAFVVAGAEVVVAKHGNRSASSKCGSADVLEALGVNIKLLPKDAQRCLEKIGIAFLFAPVYHPAMKAIVPVRKALGIPTIFNNLGPFLNPAKVKRQLIGVPNIQKARLLARVASKLSYEYLMIVNSEDGLDEISLSSKTNTFTVKGKSIFQSTLDPKEYGFSYMSLKKIQGGGTQKNSQILRSVLNGKKSAYCDVVILNSAVALVVAGKVPTVTDGIYKAKQSIASGSAFKKLEELIKETNK